MKNEWTTECPKRSEGVEMKPRIVCCAGNAKYFPRVKRCLKRFEDSTDLSILKFFLSYDQVKEDPEDITILYDQEASKRIDSLAVSPNFEKIWSRGAYMKLFSDRMLRNFLSDSERYLLVDADIIPFEGWDEIFEYRSELKFLGFKVYRKYDGPEITAIPDSPGFHGGLLRIEHPSKVLELSEQIMGNLQSGTSYVHSEEGVLSIAGSRLGVLGIKDPKFCCMFREDESLPIDLLMENYLDHARKAVMVHSYYGASSRKEYTNFCLQSLKNTYKENCVLFKRLCGCSSNFGDKQNEY